MKLTDDRTAKIWGGDWQTRVRSYLRQQGHKDIQDFLGRFLAMPYVKVAKRLGSDVAPIQVIWLQYREGLEKGNLREVALDALAREISDKLKRGWGHKIHLEFNRANAFARWIGEIKECAPEFEPYCQATWKALLGLSPGDKWVPTGPADPILVAAFEIGWPIQENRIHE